MAAASPRRSCRWRCRAMPPARSPRSTTWSLSPRWASAARRCRRSPRSAASPWRRASRRTNTAPRCRSRAARSVKSRRVRMRRAPPWKCASCSTTCRRGASSCAPSAPNWAISRNGCVHWRWRVRTWNCGCRTTASRRAATGPATCTPMRVWAKPWARTSRGNRCAWTTARPACACTGGSRSRSTRAPAPTSSTCTSMAARYATAASRMR